MFQRLARNYLGVVSQAVTQFREEIRLERCREFHRRSDSKFAPAWIAPIVEISCYGNSTVFNRRTYSSIPFNIHESLAKRSDSNLGAVATFCPRLRRTPAYSLVKLPMW